MKHKRIPLLNGTVVVPDDYIIVEQTRTAKSNFAGIVTAKNRKLPNYLVLSETSISGYTLPDIDRLCEYLGRLYPELEEVREHEVKPIYDEEGTVMNFSEWCTSPSLELTPVLEVTDMDNLFFGSGIIREET